MHFYRSFFSLFPKFHFSQKKFLFVISTHKQQYPLHFYRLFFALFHFSPKKSILSIRHFYPQTTIPPALLQIIFCTFALFPPKNSILSILPKLLQIIFSTISLFPIKSTKFPSCAYWTKSLSCLFSVHIMVLDFPHFVFF